MPYHSIQRGAAAWQPLFVLNTHTSAAQPVLRQGLFLRRDRRVSPAAPAFLPPDSAALSSGLCPARKHAHSRRCCPLPPQAPVMRMHTPMLCRCVSIPCGKAAPAILLRDACPHKKYGVFPRNTPYFYFILCFSKQHIAFLFAVRNGSAALSFHLIRSYRYDQSRTCQARNYDPH